MAYQVIVNKAQDFVIVVDQKQGPQGDVTPEAIAAKEAAEEAAKESAESADKAKESELNAKESEINAAESADHAANDAALIYSYINAPAYDPDKTYNYINPDGKPDVVVCDDGYAYRCIGDNIQGEFPPTSLNWVRIPEVKGDLFVLVEHGDGYAITQSLTPGKKESDFFEKTPGGAITFKPIIIGEEEAQRDFVPRNSGKGNLGTDKNPWNGVYANKGYFNNFSNVTNTADMDKPVSNPQKNYIDTQDAAILTNAVNQLNTHNSSDTAHSDIRDILKNAVGIPEWDGNKYVLKFKAFDGATLEIDLPIEGLAKDLDYDPATHEIILIKQDGTKLRVSIVDLVDIYKGFNGVHIQTSVETGNIIKATLKAGSITETELSAALLAKINGKESAITAGSTTQYWRGDKTWRDLATDVRAVVLTGLSTATNAVIAATDTFLGALGKIQAQISAHKGAKGTTEHGLGDGANAGFSTNDFTTAEKNKLTGISAGATAVTVENVLTSTNTDNALSAAQGKTLNDNKANLSGAAFTGPVQVIGSSIYFYIASSATADTVNDVRIRNNAGVITFEKCTVANTAKGKGTWTATGTNFIQIT